MPSILVLVAIQHGVVIPQTKPTLPPLPQAKVSAASPDWVRREFRIRKEHLAFSAIVPKAATQVKSKGKKESSNLLSDGHSGLLWCEYSTKVDRVHWEQLLKPPLSGYDDYAIKDGKKYRDVKTHREVHRNGWIGHFNTSRLAYTGIIDEYAIEIELTNQKDMKVCYYMAKKGFQLLDEVGLWKIIDSMKLLKD